MRIGFKFLLTGICSILIVSAIPGTAQQAPAFKPVATVKQLMEALIIPASDQIFQLAAEGPKTSDEWTAVRNSAIVLAESGNLLMIGRRAPDNKAWTKESQALIAAAQDAIKAVDTKNAEALMEAGNQVYEVCDSCHKQYMKQ